MPGAAVQAQFTDPELATIARYLDLMNTAMADHRASIESGRLTLAPAAAACLRPGSGTRPGLLLGVVRAGPDPLCVPRPRRRWPSRLALECSTAGCGRQVATRAAWSR